MNPELQEAIDFHVAVLAEGGKALLAAAEQAYRAGGYSEAAFEAHLENRTAEIAAEVSSAAEPPEFSFEECSALIGL